MSVSYESLGHVPGYSSWLAAQDWTEAYERHRRNLQLIGANDVVNPAARSDKSSPIYGMPILNADHAKTVIVLKRGMSAGFAGIENELFYDRRTSMLFGDAKTSLTGLVSEIKNV